MKIHRGLLVFHFLQFPELLNLLGLKYFLISGSAVADPELIDRQAEARRIL